MKMLPPSLIPLLFLALPSLSQASPQPALVDYSDFHLIPRNTLFFRQLQDLQTFNGSLGGAAAAPITNSGDTKRPFEVAGNTFTTFSDAAQRTCDNQANACSNAANAQGNKGSVTVNDCNTQKQQCESTQSSAKVQDFTTAVATKNFGADPQFPAFDLICDV